VKKCFWFILESTAGSHTARYPSSCFLGAIESEFPASPFSKTTCITCSVYITLSVSRQVHSLSHRAFYTEYDRALPFSINYQCLLVSLRSSSSCLRHLPRRTIPFIFPSVSVLEGSSYASCDQSCYPSFCVLYVGYSSCPWLYVILLHFSHDRSNWSSPSFPSTTFRNFQGITFP
jgi:hypothetical protein